MAANTELHHTIIRLSGNRRVAEMYDGLHAHLTIARLHRAALRPRQSRLDFDMPSMNRLSKRYVIVMLRRCRVRCASISGERSANW